MKKILFLLFALSFTSCYTDEPYMENSKNHNNSSNGYNSDDENDNGRIVWHDCKKCDESGDCFACYGDGMWLGDKKECPYCDGTGICDQCDGAGKWYQIIY